MHDDLDPRPYILALLHRWYWIVAATVGAALLALLVSFLQSPTYEATALVAVTQPRYVLQFDPRFATVEDGQTAYRAYPELALSGHVLIQLLQDLDTADSELNSLRDLRPLVRAEGGADPSLVRLSARSEDPVRAAHVANQWAFRFINHANVIYGATDEDQLAFLERQLEQTTAELEAAEQDLIEFQSHNRASILELQLSSLRELQAEYLDGQRALNHTIRDVRGLRRQVQQQPPDRAAGLSDRLTALLLQVKAFNAELDAPLQFRLDNPTDVSHQTSAQQMASLESLASILQATSREIDESLSQLEPRILDAQQRLQEISVEESRLTRRHELVGETHLTVARKVEEARISTQDVSGEVRLASGASVPEHPIRPRKLLSSVVAGMLAFFVAIGSVFAATWWRSGNSRQD